MKRNEAMRHRLAIREAVLLAAWLAAAGGMAGCSGNEESSEFLEHKWHKFGNVLASEVVAEGRWNLQVQVPANPAGPVDVSVWATGVLQWAVNVNAYDYNQEIH